MSATNESHDCFTHADWNPGAESVSEPVSGTCAICGSTVEHYCDEHQPTDEAPTCIDYERHTDAPIYGIDYTCPVCNRDLTMRLKKLGTFRQGTDSMVYGP